MSLTSFIGIHGYPFDHSFLKGISCQKQYYVNSFNGDWFNEAEGHDIPAETRIVNAAENIADSIFIDHGTGMLSAGYRRVKAVFAQAIVNSLPDLIPG